MAFVARNITDEDRVKYRLNEHGVGIRANVSHARAWAIDEDNEMFLRFMRSGREESQGRHSWAFYYKGEYIYFAQSSSKSKKTEFKRESFYKLYDFEFPKDFQGSKEDVFENIKSGFEVLRGGHTSLSRLPESVENIINFEIVE